MHNQSVHKAQYLQSANVTPPVHTANNEQCCGKVCKQVESDFITRELAVLGGKQGRQSILTTQEIIKNRQKSSLWKAYESIAAKSSEDDSWMHSAMELYNRTLEILQKELGPNHSDEATVSNNMGNFLQANGSLDEAMELYVQVLCQCNSTQAVESGNEVQCQSP